MAEGSALFEEAKARYGATTAAVGDRVVDEGELRRSAEQRRLYRTRLQQAAGRFESALDYDADNAAARRALADVTIEMWRTAEADANPELMELNAREGERYAPGVYTTELRGMARLRLTASVADADAYIYRYVPVGEQRRLVPAPYDLATGETGAPSEQFSALAENRLGPLPVDRELAPGAYVVVIRKAGYRETIVPASLARGGQLELSPSLLHEEEIPAGFVYVPAFRPQLYGPFPRSKSAAYVSVPIGPFFIQEREVTFGDYEQFLNDLIARGETAEAARRIPRDFGFVYMQIEGGKVAWNRAVAVEAWRKWPLRGVSWNDAEAYAAWRGARDGRRYRLPTEDEWEAAARGGDGRRYSWGDTFWPQAAKLTQVYNATPGGATPATDAPFADVSPFGARDMAGSVAEWCADTVAAGLGRAASAGGANGSEYAIRGNAWALTPVGLECTFRSSGPADYFHSTVGFRLAADLDESAR
jgi:serine/threonine-protein kinase